MKERRLSSRLEAMHGRPGTPPGIARTQATSGGGHGKRPDGSRTPEHEAGHHHPRENGRQP
ncbi:hypothetical protein MICRO80W_110027 [Micrococcus luteus]|nr:hypothetical protein MICRO80W_110027 [Micrococcus luteus]